MFHNGVWHDAILKEVWYVPDASAQLFSVKIAAPNGYSTILNEKEIVIRRGDGIIASAGKLLIIMYWGFGCLFHDTVQRSTWQHKWKN
jgi:hypothetical protein